MKSYFNCLFLCCALIATAQQEKDPFTLDANFFYGNIAEHNSDISHLIKGHPTGVIFSYNQKTFGKNAWESRFNYPDYGASFIYQDLKNETLGNNFGVYAHYNFYFFKRNLMFRIGQGLAYNTNPYDKVDNYRNNAFGTTLLSSTYLMLNYKKENIFNNFGLQTGLSLIHYSNANVKAPNSSINSITFNLGVNYILDNEAQTEYIKHVDNKFTEKVKYNIAVRTGVNESDVIDTGQYAFYVISAYADKRLNHKSAIQLGTDVFFSNFLKTHIRYKSVAFPEDNVSGDEDYKRIGLFVGHELFINKTSLITQLGYYVYYPFDFEGRVYNRVGLKRYFGDKIYGALTLKSHGAKAEAVELGIGIRL
ncbi:acyloxyacyl hydrolase [Olleya aquimaris]|uniref:Acyloxyacyl hydrolase n=1 Tax=Olleya sediminilitoris TaxID=2795739 RepID=A0ABS1WJ53_9FLAO|nr:acyloxyacyl hydrolase [Olleya sediminilitoris]AXO81230.1 acyloxyacyl hydrolase [Olleya aquimaris]MBL7559152.1 acyloxyacyl hydrolase [Olleya sediminilitoris]